MYSDDFEKWWYKNGIHYPTYNETIISTMKELAFKAWVSGIRSLEPDGIGCETW